MRMKLTKEIIEGIRLIKMYAWELGTLIFCFMIYLTIKS